MTTFIQSRQFSLRPPQRDADALTGGMPMSHLPRGLLVIFFAAAIVASGLGYLHYNAKRLSEYHGAQLHAIVDLTHYAIMAHRGDNELLSGDRSESISTVRGLFTRAEWYAQALLNGGENGRGKILPFDGSVKREQALQLRKMIGFLRHLSEQRYTAGAADRTELDRRYDDLFVQLIKLNQSLAHSISNEMKGALQQFLITA